MIIMFDYICQGLALTNGHQRDVYHNEIGLCAKNISIDSNSIVYISRRVYVTF